MMNEVLWPPLAKCHLHRVQHQFGPQVVGHRPADDLAAPGVHHHGQIREPARRRHMGDVGDPDLVRPRRRQVAVDQIRRWPGVLVTPRDHKATVPVAGAHQSGLAHQPRDPLAAMPPALCPQIGMHPRCPMGMAYVACTVRTRFSKASSTTAWAEGGQAEPGMVSYPGKTGHARHGGDRQAGLVRAHELEEPDGTAPVCRPNQAAAFEGTSRSAMLGSGSTLIRFAAQAPRPSCLSAAAIQTPIDCAVGTNFRARSSGDRPARTRSTIWRRNSGEQGRRVLGIRNTPGGSLRVSTKPGHSQSHPAEPRPWNDMRSSMGELKLVGMKAVYDEALSNALRRQHRPPRSSAACRKPRRSPRSRRVPSVTGCPPPGCR